MSETCNELFKGILKAHWRAAKRAKSQIRYDSSHDNYWKGRIEVAEDIYFDLFSEDLNEPIKEETE